MIHLLFENQQIVWFAENEKSDCVSTIALSWWRDSDYRERRSKEIIKCDQI